MEHQFIEITVWESLDRSYTVLFEETDPVRGRVEPAGTVLGTIHPEVIATLESLDYTVEE